jgi:hypothetical protein
MGCYKLVGKIGGITIGTKKRPAYLCTGHCSPPGESECMEAVNSQGSSCRKCEVDCYRKGWSKEAVTRDNAFRIMKKNGRVRTLSK